MFFKWHSSLIRSTMSTSSNKFIVIISFLFLLSNSNFLIIPSVEAQKASNNPSLLERFWEIGCEFSGVVTRVRRSAPTPEEPNFDDPEELFKYLYPLADVKPGEDLNGENGSQRSQHGTHSLSSWLEDLLELWHSECHHRRNRRSSRRMSEFNREASTEPRRRFHAGMFGKRNRDKTGAEGERRNSTLGILSSNDDGGDMDGEYKYVLPQPLDDGNNGTSAESDTDGDGDSEEDDDDDGENALRGDKVEEILEEIKDKDKDKDKFKPGGGSGSDGSTTPAGPVEKPVEAPKEDIFFSQYGGDIEYFFPLLSFGIPFDGEITLLGFHGFRGIFPY